MDLLVKNTHYFFEVYFDFIVSEWLLVFSALMVLCWWWISRNRDKSRRKFLVLIHAIYGATVLGITLFHRNRVGTQEILLNPWEILKEIFSDNKVHIIRAIVSNICLFIPIGFFSRMSKESGAYWRATIVGVAFSGFIEIMQYICCRGTLETLDFICNVFGAWLGTVIIEMIYQIWRKLKCLYLQTKH